MWSAISSRSNCPCWEKNCTSILSRKQHGQPRNRRKKSKVGGLDGLKRKQRMDSFTPINSGPGLRKGHLVILTLLLGLGLAVVGVTGYFRLGSDSAALRSSLMKSTPAQWQKKIAVHVGGFTMGVVRTTLRWVKLPPEPRAAIEALRTAEVGVYTLQTDPSSVDQERIVAAADK